MSNAPRHRSESNERLNIGYIAIPKASTGHTRTWSQDQETPQPALSEGHDRDQPHEGSRARGQPTPRARAKKSVCARKLASASSCSGRSRD